MFFDARLPERTLGSLPTIPRVLCAKSTAASSHPPLPQDTGKTTVRSLLHAVCTESLYISGK